MRRFPKYKFALISVCDTLGGILLLISGSFVDGKLMTLLVQVRRRSPRGSPAMRRCALTAARCAPRPLRPPPSPLLLLLLAPFVPPGCRARNYHWEYSHSAPQVGDARCWRVPGPGAWLMRAHPRFHMWNYVGATVVLLGIVCNTIPAFTSHEGGLIKNVWYVIPLFLSNVFVALSSIMQEVVLKGQVRQRALRRAGQRDMCPPFREWQDMDLYYYQLWIAIFQFTLSTLLSPLSFMLQMRHARVSELPGNFFDGLLCWCVFVPPPARARSCAHVACHRLPGTDPTHASPEVHAACGDAFASLLIYYVLVILLNITIAVTIKLGSAVRARVPARSTLHSHVLTPCVDAAQAAMNVAMTTAVPVQYTAFSIKIPFLVEKTTRLSFWNIIGLVRRCCCVAWWWARVADWLCLPQVVTVGGLVAYNAAPEAGGEQGAPDAALHRPSCAVSHAVCCHGWRRRWRRAQVPAHDGIAGGHSVAHAVPPPEDGGTSSGCAGGGPRITLPSAARGA